eukprot:TRINITY_DN44837_c0_g1_i1.p1 TRINITY_DN44837_c0_g1~~TRINITY_DN44837_c0_g1_i1.p1  ORF type:complete len:486 (+),score=148.97 TRINITY_DN44837_c0_g1_i1:55-1512(+)
MGVQQPPPLSVLRQIDSLYGAEAQVQKSSGGGLCLKALAAELGVLLEAPPREAHVLVVGDPGSGKSAFLNAIAQEVVVPVRSASSRGRAPLAWVRHKSAGSEHGSALPRLLVEASERHAGWLKGADAVSACLAGSSASSRLEGIDVVEASWRSEPASVEALSWLASQVDVIVCLLDSQQPQAASDELLQWLARVTAATPPAADGAAPVEPPVVQFVLSKADLIPRESDKIRIVAKASKLVSSQLNRGFEILPVAAGELRSLLDNLDVDVPSQLTFGGRTFPAKEDAQEEFGGGKSGKKTGAETAAVRAIKAARDRASQRLDAGLAMARRDCQSLAALVETRRSSAVAQVVPVSPKTKLLQAGGAMMLVTVFVPFVLDDDIDPSVVKLWVGVTAFLAGLCLVMAFLLPSKSAAVASEVPTDQAASRDVAVLEEQARYLRLLLRQLGLWCGQDTAEQSSMPEAAALGAAGDGAGAARQRTVGESSSL